MSKNDRGKKYRKGQFAPNPDKRPFDRGAFDVEDEYGKDCWMSDTNFENKEDK